MKTWVAGIVAGAMFGATALYAAGGDIRVTPVLAEGVVAVSFNAAAAADAELRPVVESGLLLTLTFTVELKRPANMWWDRTVAHQTVGASVKFDNLTGVYQVSRTEGGHVTWSDRTRDFAEARQWLTTFDRVKLSAGDGLEPSSDYYILVRMRTSPRRTFPLWPWTPDDGAGRADFTFIR